MPDRLAPNFQILPRAQRELWPQLAPLSAMGLVLYGGTAIALRLGHRQSVDYDFFSSRPLDKAALRHELPALEEGPVLQDTPETLVAMANTPQGMVKLSFFGGMRIGRVGVPDWTEDGVLLVASLTDLLATKLKAILDRAEAKDYSDIAAMLRAGVSLPNGLAAFRTLFAGEPATVLKAIGYFGDGDLAALPQHDRDILSRSRDQVRDLPVMPAASADLAGD